MAPDFSRSQQYVLSNDPLLFGVSHQQLISGRALVGMHMYMKGGEGGVCTLDP